MIWLVQNAMFGDEYGYDNFIAAIDASGDRRIPIHYVMWDATIDLKLTDVSPGDVIPFGTREFVAYGRKVGWNVYWNESFNYPDLLVLGEDFINHDMQVDALDKLDVPSSATGKVFVREAAGFNIIKGKVISSYAWPEWVEGFKWKDVTTKHQHDWHPINGETQFVVAPVKTITDEYRVWIIDNKVVTSSQYIINGEIEYRNTDDHYEVNSYAQKIADQRLFSMGNYVLDIFRTPAGLKVGEINCLHCSGWYAIDSRKVVAALMEANRAD